MLKSISFSKDVDAIMTQNSTLLHRFFSDEHGYQVLYQVTPLGFMTTGSSVLQQLSF